MPTPIRKVTQYMASDDSLHNSIQAVKQHENVLEASRQLQSLLSFSFTTMRPASIIKQLLMEDQKVMDILRTFAKKKPRK